MKKLLMVLVAVFVFFTGAAESQAFRFVGNVYDSVTGAPIQGVRVLVYRQMPGDGSWGYWGEVQTWWETATYIVDFPQGSYALMFWKDGYKSQLYLGAYDWVTVNVIQSPGGEGESVLPAVFLNPDAVGFAGWREVLLTDYSSGREAGNFVAWITRVGFPEAKYDGFLVWATLEGQAHDNLQTTGTDLVGRKGIVVPFGEGREVRIPYEIPSVAPRTTVVSYLHIANVPVWVARVTNMTQTQRDKYFRQHKRQEEYNRILSEAVWHTEAKVQIYWTHGQP